MSDANLVGQPLSRKSKSYWLCLVQENPRWGYGKLHGELRKLGHEIGRSTVRDLWTSQHAPPAPQRAEQASSWGSCLRHDRQQFRAGDFLTVETAWLKTLYVFFFIEWGRRRVHFAGCTAPPTAERVTQQARQLTWTVPDAQQAMRFLIGDRAAKFTASFDTGFAAEGSEIVQRPDHTPTTKALAERWIRAGRGECLDRLLLWGEGHLHRGVLEYVAYDNRARTKALSSAVRSPSSAAVEKVRSTVVMYSGVSSMNYYREAA